MNSETKRKLNALNMNEFSDAIEYQENLPSVFYPMDFMSRIDLIVDQVYQNKTNEKIKRRIKHAQLRYTNATVESIDFDARNMNPAPVAELSTLKFMDKATNVIVLGFTGAGKTYLSCAVAKAACLADIKTFYIRLPDLLQLRAEQNILHREKNLLKKLASYKLLVIDEWLINKPDEKDLQFLYELMELRYDNSSTIFVTQYKVAEWHPRLGGQVRADSIMDRIVHNAITIDSGSVNMREKFDSLKKNG